MRHFDGASQFGMCGQGMLMMLSRNHSFHLWVGCGVGTNTRGEIMAMWRLLFFATKKKLLCHYRSLVTQKLLWTRQ